jgi:hypothetical protein
MGKYGGHMGKYGGHIGKYGGHMGKNGEPIYDLGHMGISLKLNSGKIMADIWELLYPLLQYCLAITPCKKVPIRIPNLGPKLESQSDLLNQGPKLAQYCDSTLLCYEIMWYYCAVTGESKKKNSRVGQRKKSRVAEPQVIFGVPTSENNF